MHEVADHINHALLEPLEEYRLTDEIPKIPLEEDHAPRDSLISIMQRPGAPMGFLIGY